MKQRRERREVRQTTRRVAVPSYANVTTTLALVIAVGTGGAYAVSQIGPEDIGKSAIRAKHIKRSAVTTPKIKRGAVTADKLAEGVEGLRGPIGPTGPQGSIGAEGPQGPVGLEGPQGPVGLEGPRGATGPTGTTGEPGSAVAYAEIGSSGSISKAKNIDTANVTHPATGVYCIGDLDFNLGNAVATTQAASTTDTRDRIVQILMSSPSSIPFGCNTGDRLRVHIVDLGLLGTTTAGLVDGYFHLWLED